MGCFFVSSFLFSKSKLYSALWLEPRETVLRQRKPGLQQRGLVGDGVGEACGPEAHLQNRLPFLVRQSLHGRFLKVLLDVIVILLLCPLHILIPLAYVLRSDAIIL